MSVILIKRQVLQSATSDAESHPLFGGLRTGNFFILPKESNFEKNMDTVLEKREVHALNLMARSALG